MKIQENKGITLIALIITIIVLLILAGITIKLTIGQDGILTQAQNAGVKHQEEEAKQKLELALLDLQAEKKVNKEYNENEYIDNYLTSKQMVVMEDIVLVDGWQFKIDRSIPQIAIALGKGGESREIKLTTKVDNATDYTKANINIEIIYEGEISSIQINGQEQTIPEKLDGKYILTKEVLQNGTYTILVKDEKGNYKTGIASITEISEDLEITTVEQLVVFRDRVNKGATYEGKTVALMNDIDLSSVCYKVDGTPINDISWEPIGTETNKFNGDFNGNYHVIRNLYINSNKYEKAGLFYSNDGIIRNLILDTISIYIDFNTEIAESTSLFIGGITAKNNGDIINCGIESGKITGINKTNSSKLYRSISVVGICASNANNINGCYNKAEIIGEQVASNSSHTFVAGICGVSNGNISNCYNTGNITSLYSEANMIGGIVGRITGGTIENSYNTGIINGDAKNSSYNLKGGMVGQNGYSNDTVGTIENSYCSTTSATYSYYYKGTNSSTTGRISSEILKGYATTLGDAYTNDIKNEEGNYLNFGYPILKWEIEV